MPVERPAIVWVGAHPSNYSEGRGGCSPEAIVLHIMAGTLAGTDAWFNDPRSRASTHFGVGKAGAIHGYVKTEDTAYANGAIEPGYTAALIDENRRADGSYINPNLWTLSIEHEGQSGDAVPDAQFDASTRLAAWLWQDVILTGTATGLALDRDHILGHYEISPRSRPNCPGFGEPFFQRYIARVRELLAPAPVPPPVPPPTPPPPDYEARWRDAEKRAAEWRAVADHRRDVMTIQAAALDEIAERATEQARNLRKEVW